MTQKGFTHIKLFSSSSDVAVFCMYIWCVAVKYSSHKFR